MSNRRLFNQGISLVEGLIGVAIIGITVVGSVTTFNLYVKAGASNLSNIQSSYLINEGIETLFYLKDLGWDLNIGNLTPGGKYYLSWNGTRWVTTVTSTLIDAKYDRYFILASTYRDGGGNLALSGTPDNDSRKATVYVAWRNNTATTSKSTVTYIFDIYKN